MDDRRRDGGTNFILRINEQETRLTLQEHDDDDDGGGGDDDIHCCMDTMSSFHVKVVVRIFTVCFIGYHACHRG